MLDYKHRIIGNPAEGSTTASVAVTSSTNVLIFAPWRPVRVIRWGMVCITTVNDSTNALTLTCDLRPTAGSDTNRVTGATTVVAAQSGWNASNLPAFYYDAAGGSITLTASTSQVAAGAAVYHNVNPAKPSTTYSPYYPDPDTALDSPGGVNTGFVVYPGQEVVIKVQTTAPNAGAGKFFLEVEEQAFVAPGNNLPNLATGVPSAIVPTPSRPGTLTRYLS